ncbi:934_t:CDS:1, partial [Ambispora gerdemannii]
DDNVYYNKDTPWKLKDARYTQMGRYSLQSNINQPGDGNVYYNKDTSLNQKRNSYRQENQMDGSSRHPYFPPIREKSDVLQGSRSNQYSQEKPQRNGYETDKSLWNGYGAEKSGKSVFRPHQDSTLEQQPQNLCLTYDKFSQTMPASISKDPPLITVEKIDQLLEEKQKLLLTINRLETQHKNLESKFDELFIRKQQTEKDNQQLKDQRDSLINERKSEHHLRQSSQRRNINLGTNAQDLKLTLEKLQIQFDEAQEENRSTNTKCRVCSVETITHAILPCYHFVMCEKCAQAAKKCCVCEKQKEGIARFYYG